jgi:tetratricopeptide (TPR) repeat protein
LSQKIVHQKEATLRLPLDASLNNIQLTGTRLLGDVFRQLGYLQKSQDLLEKVERVITQEKYPQAKALVLLSLGNTYQAFGNRNRFLADSQENNQKDYYQLATDSYRKAVEEAADASLVKVQAQLNLLSLLVDSKRGVGVNFKEAKELRLQILSQLSQLSKLLPTRQIIYAENSLVKSLVSLKNAELKTASNLANSNAEKTEKLSNYCLLNSSIVPESVAESVSVNTEAVSWREIVELGAKAVKLARELGDLRATAYALGTLGGVYEENQQWFEAQKCTEKALLLSQMFS